MDTPESKGYLNCHKPSFPVSIICLALQPVKEEWVVSIKSKCLRSGVPFFFKQWGGVNKKKAGRVLEGRIWDQMPETEDLTLV
jgi:hypothetical protein